MGQHNSKSCLEQLHHLRQQERQAYRLRLDPRSVSDLDPNAELKAIFDEIDLNHDGNIDRVELETALVKMGISVSPLQLKATMSAVDKNKDSLIDFQEFVELVKRTPAFAELEQTFRQFDIDHDGHITEAELRKVMRTLKMPDSDKDIKAMFKDVDMNSDGKISFGEFAQMMKDQQLHGSLRELFEHFDSDGDGYIVLSELQVVCRTLSLTDDEQEILDMFEYADKNHDQKICFEEFATMLTEKNVLDT